jgi:hypothetical protein
VCVYRMSLDGPLWRPPGTWSPTVNNPGLQDKIDRVTENLRSPEGGGGLFLQSWAKYCDTRSGPTCFIWFNDPSWLYPEVVVAPIKKDSQESILHRQSLREPQPKHWREKESPGT